MVVDFIGIVVSVSLLFISESLPFIKTKIPANGILHTVLSLVTKKHESPSNQEQSQEQAQEQSHVQEVRITCKNKNTTVIIRSG